MLATEGKNEPDKHPTRCRCPRCGPYVEAIGEGERGGTRTQEGELLRDCLACLVQRIHTTMRRPDVPAS